MSSRHSPRTSRNAQGDYRMTTFQPNLAVPPQNIKRQRSPLQAGTQNRDASNPPPYQPDTGIYEPLLHRRDSSLASTSDAIDSQQLNTGATSSNLLLKPSNTSSLFYTHIHERRIARTPSPTPSEIEALNDNNTFSLSKYLNPTYWFRKDRILYLVIIVAAIVILILFSVFDKQIVVWFKPIAKKIRELPAGFLIPIGILVVLSFPPLFGHELIELLCGFVYGAGIGFAIAACGVLLGEIANFIVFKFFCTTRGLKLERTNIRYGSFAQIIRQGGFKIAIIARYSAIPAHFATAVFATAGMNIFTFILAAILSLPKQFIKVYVGSILAEDGSGDESSSQSHKNKLIEIVVLIGTIVITIFAMRYINGKLNEAKIDVIYRRRKDRQLKMQHAFVTADSSVNVEVQAVAESNRPAIISPQPLDAARSTFEV